MASSTPGPAPASTDPVTGRLLVVERDELVRRMLASSLDRQGHSVLTADDLKTAKAELESETFDLIVLDADLDTENGLDLLDWLDQKGTTIPVIVASARDKTNQIVQAFERGAADYITKPINLSVISSRIRAMLTLVADADSTMARRRPLEALRQLDLPGIDAKLGQAGGGAATLRAVNDVLRDALHAERASVFRFDPDRFELLTVVAHGEPAEDESPLIRMPADAGLAGATFGLDRLLNIPDAYQDERFNPAFDQQTGFQTRSVLCFPLHNEIGRPIGVAQVLNHEHGAFTAESEIIAGQLATRCAHALELAFVEDPGEINLAATIVAESPVLADDTVLLTSDEATPIIVPDPTRPESMIDATLGRYRLKAILGSGMQGVVFHAVDELLERDVAIKLLGLQAGRRELVHSQFMIEARTMARLTHANTVSIYDVGEYEGSLFLVMEKCRHTAGSLLAAKSPLDYATCLQIIRDACLGLDAAHRRGMVHRDIKPDNILLDADGVAKLSDFGLAMAANTTDVTGDNRIVGTPHYMPPEQCRAQPVDHRSDIYALGGTFYHLVTGAPPFGEYKTVDAVLTAHCTQDLPDPQSAHEQVTADCATVIRMCMAKQPAERYQNTAALVEDIQALLDRSDVA